MVGETGGPAVDEYKMFRGFDVRGGFHMHLLGCVSLLVGEVGDTFLTQEVNVNAPATSTNTHMCIWLVLLHLDIPSPFRTQAFVVSASCKWL